MDILQVFDQLDTSTECDALLGLVMLQFEGEEINMNSMEGVEVIKGREGDQVNGASTLMSMRLKNLENQNLENFPRRRKRKRAQMEGADNCPNSGNSQQGSMSPVNNKMNLRPRNVNRGMGRGRGINPQNQSNGPRAFRRGGPRRQMQLRNVPSNPVPPHVQNRGMRPKNTNNEVINGMEDEV